MAKHLSGTDKKKKPVVGDAEAQALVQELDSLRATVLWKTSGLANEQLHLRPFEDSLSIAGILAHLAFIENYWFKVVLHGETPSAPWTTVNWKEDPNFEWDFALTKSASYLRKLWEDAVEKSDDLWAEVVEQNAPLDFLRPWEDGGTEVTIRWILQLLVQDYARSVEQLSRLIDEIDTIEDVLPFPL